MKILLRGLVSVFVLVPPLLHGCGVLTVDVDVYKGPLVNHEDVQIEQLAVMAIGARPLLVRLRDDLEDAYRKAEEKKAQEEGRPATRVKIGCHTNLRYVEDADCLTNQDARTVNAILGLYLDQRRSALAQLVNEGREIFEEVKRLAHEVDDFESDAELWKQIEAAVQASLARTPSLVVDANAKSAVQRALRRNDRGYRDLPDLSALLQEPGDPARAVSDSSDFARLTRQDKVMEVVARLLPHPLDADLRDRLVRRLVRIGHGFVRGRELIDRGLVIALEFIALLEAEGRAVPNLGQVRARAIDIVRRLVRPDRLPTASGNRNLPRESREQLRMIVSQVSEQEGHAADSQALRAWLSAAPLESALALKAAHLWMKSNYAPSEDRATTHPDEEGAHAGYLRYGIARSLTFTEEESREMDAAFDDFQFLAQVISDLGFDRGRLDMGLESLIESYLHARDELGASRNESDDVLLTRRRLTAGLTHFAEKVLFVVNHDAVIRACDDVGGDCRESYVMVLESIGNSILTLNDELHHNWSHEASESGVAHREAQAARVAWGSDPGTRFDDLVLAIVGDPVVPLTLLEKERKELADAAAAVGPKESAELSARRALELGEPVLATKSAAHDKAKAEAGAAQKLLDDWGSASILSAATEWAQSANQPDATRKDRLLQLAQHLAKKRVVIVQRGNAENAESRAIANVVAALERQAGALTASATEKRTGPDVVVEVTAALDATATDAERRKEETEKDRSAHERRVASLRATAAEAQNALVAARTLASAKQRIWNEELDGLKTTSAAQIRSVRDQVLASARAVSTVPRRRDILQTLEQELRKRAVAAPIPERTDLENAATLVAAQPLSGLPDLVIPDNPKRATDVLDAVIATLRASRVTAIAKGNSELALQIQEALEKAENQRSLLVYIRPPASFLRNSSPVTTLQDNRVGETNELEAVAGTFMGTRPDKAQRQRLQTQLAIDQQFWQNINRIRVTGTGDTTYALIKDDIGNWYVKGYVGDPKTVIKGVQSIALAGLSQSLKANAIERVEQLDRARATGKAAEAATTPTVLEKQVGHFRARYEDATETDAKDLKAEFDTLVASVKEGWTKAAAGKEGTLAKKTTAELLLLVDAAATEPFKTPPALPAEKGAKQAEFCADLLDRCADFETALLARLDVKELVDASAVDARRKELVTQEAKAAAADLALAEAKEHLKTLEALAQEVPVEDELLAAQAREKDERAAADSAKKAADSARADLVAAEAAHAKALALVRDLRRSTIEIVGGKAQRFVDRRADAIEDYTTALGVLGQRTDDAR